MAGPRAEITHAEMTLATNATEQFSQQSRNIFQQLDSFLVTESARYQGNQAVMFQRARVKLNDTGLQIGALCNTMQTRMGAVNVAYANTDEEAGSAMGASAINSFQVPSILS